MAKKTKAGLLKAISGTGAINRSQVRFKHHPNTESHTKACAKCDYGDASVGPWVEVNIPLSTRRDITWAFAEFIEVADKAVKYLGAKMPAKLAEHGTYKGRGVLAGMGLDKKGKPMIYVAVEQPA